MCKGVRKRMPGIKFLKSRDIEFYKEQLIRYIYESNRNAAYMESYSKNDAKDKYEELLSYSKEKKAIVYGAIEEGNLIGFIWAYRYAFREDQSRLYVSILHVDKAYRNMHVGRELLTTVEERAAKEKINTVYLHAEADNLGAVRFYEKNGYEIERIQLAKRKFENIDDIKCVRGGGVK